MMFQGIRTLKGIEIEATQVMFCKESVWILPVSWDLKFKSNELICLAEETSRQDNIKAVTQISFTSLILVYSEEEQQVEKKGKKKM